jgi:hypothetical protein
LEDFGGFLEDSGGFQAKNLTNKNKNNFFLTKNPPKSSNI